MNATVKAGYVVGDNGKILLQIPTDGQFGFSLFDEDDSWAGGIGAGLKTWTAIPEDDKRITEEDKKRLGWILDEWRSGNW